MREQSEKKKNSRKASNRNKGKEIKTEPKI